ncbi:Flp pilus assembly protein CpaB [Caulobacter sp. KR2-114]|uniref:Flp pilus assembly protein CpaB n=1 Tax=Caulobacter sp. KR2-114 TaxID=3400912 RepID=UPI003BFB3F11
MRTGTIISLGASAVLGVGALLVAKVWLPHAAQGSPSAKAPAPAEATVPVVVASGAIPYGGKLDASHLVLAHLPQGAVPQGAYSSIEQVTSQNGGAPVAVVAISAREPILPTKVSGAGAKPTLSAMITEGMRAYTIGISDTSGGGGHILPSDRVDVVLTREVPLPQKVRDDCGGCKRYVTNVVIQNVRILGMDLNADPSSTQPVLAHTATLEVSMADAQRLSLAAQAGSLSLALRRTGQGEVDPVRPMGVRDLGPLDTPMAPHAAGLRSVSHASRAKPAAAAARHSIIVVNGDARSAVDVPSERGL